MHAGAEKHFTKNETLSFSMSINYKYVKIKKKNKWSAKRKILTYFEFHNLSQSVSYTLWFMVYVYTHAPK